MNRTRVPCRTVVGILLIAGFATAQGRPVPPAKVAEDVLAAFRADDLDALKSLAASEDPDPWVVADELCGRGEFDAAKAFARAAPRSDTKALPEYVAAQAKSESAPDARAALERAKVVRIPREVLDILDGVPTGKPDVLSIRIGLVRGWTLRKLRRNAEAAEAFRAAARPAKTIGWLRCEALSLRNAGRARLTAGDPRGALADLQQSLAVEEERADPEDLGSVLIYLSTALRHLGRFSEAIESLQKARKFKKRAGNEVSVVRILGNLGNVYSSIGDFPRALEMQTECLRRKRELGDERTILLTLNNLAIVHGSMGNYTEALALQKESLARSRAQGDQLGVARSLGNLAVSYSLMGEYAKSLSSFQESLDVYEGVKQPRGSAMTLSSMASLFERLGDLERALRYQDRALQIYRDIGDNAGIATCLGNIGNIHFWRGEFAEARDLQTQSLELARQIKAHIITSRAILNLGRIDLEEMKLDSALALHEQALELKLRLGDRKGAFIAKHNIAAIHAEQGRTGKAIEAFEALVSQAETEADHEMLVRGLTALARAKLSADDNRAALEVAQRAVRESRVLLRGLGEEEGAGARSNYAAMYAAGAQAALRLDDHGELSFFLESGRAGMLLESLGGRDRLRETAIPPQLRKLEADARAKRRVALARYERAVREGVRKEIRPRRDDLDRANREVLAAIERIQREAKAAANVLYPKALSLPEIQALLGKRDVLILYELIGEQVVALVVRRGSAKVHALGPAAEVESLLAGLSLDDPTQDPSGALASLRAKIVEPLDLAQEERRLLVSLTGALSPVPFGLLAPEREVAYCPSGTTLGLLQAERGTRGEGVFALGAPECGTGAGALHRQSAPLPGSREEAKAVGETVLLGPDASKQGLRDGLAKRPRWRAVHFACHGTVDSDRPMLSALALAPVAPDDGFLRTLDVFRMKIRADLVVLSACESAKGKIYRAEGVVGFTRAFMFAGAPRVIVSLWKVDDEATRALMVKFYELWNPKGGSKGLPAATALKRAQDHVASHAQWRHPYYWAAWQLWGLPE